MSQLNDGAQHRRKFIKIAAATVTSSALAALSSTKSQAAGRHSDPFYCAPICFLPGTLIETISGQVAIEDLRNGDLVLTEDGSLHPIRAVWHETYTRGPDQTWPSSVAAVLITRSAIHENVPSRDLYVSPKHAIYLDGYLFQSECLVNDISIRQDRYRPNVIDYYHIEFDEHHVIYAEGLAVESMLTWSDQGIASYEREYGTTPKPRQPIAPILEYNGGKRALVGLIRHAASTFVDVRDPIQVAYDRLAQRALRLIEKGEVVT